MWIFDSVRLVKLDFEAFVNPEYRMLKVSIVPSLWKPSSFDNVSYAQQQSAMTALLRDGSGFKFQKRVILDISGLFLCSVSFNETVGPLVSCVRLFCLQILTFSLEGCWGRNGRRSSRELVVRLPTKLRWSTLLPRLAILSKRRYSLRLLSVRGCSTTQQLVLITAF
jgi:hypothetical protein